MLQSVAADQREAQTGTLRELRLALLSNRGPTGLSSALGEPQSVSEGPRASDGRIHESPGYSPRVQRTGPSLKSELDNPPRPGVHLEMDALVIDRSEGHFV